jgi:hypothetical protein
MDVKTLIPSKWQQKLVGGKKLRSSLEGNQVEHLLSWTMNPTKIN